MLLLWREKQQQLLPELRRPGGKAWCKAVPLLRFCVACVRDNGLHRAAQAVEQGVVQRIQQRAARPAENGIRPGGAATVHPDVASMTRAQREALERRVLHGAQIEL